jgi:uracil-DNA glycosylase family 4
VCATSSGFWPPSVRVWIRMEEFMAQLAGAIIGETFNFYRDGLGAAARRHRLRAYLESRRDAPLLLVGEAAGYRGARVSGIPFTSERQLTGAGPAEASATIVRRVLAELGLEEQTLCWNVVPTHPHLRARPDTNRRPTRTEVEEAAPFLRELERGRRVIAVGRVAKAAAGGEYVRHPSHGGAADFRAGLLRFRVGGRRVRRFIDSGA